MLGRSLHRIVTLTVWLGCAFTPAWSQTTTPAQWYALDGSPPGTPPAIVLQSGSDFQQTILDVTIHGFYVEEISEGGETFHRISFDERRDGPLFLELGRPELPAIHHTLGALVGQTIGDPVVQVMDEVLVPGILVYPVQSRARDDATPTPVPFVWDQLFYQLTSSPYPTTDGMSRGYLGRWAGLDLVGAEVYPIRTTPANQTLHVARNFRVAMSHPGAGTPDPRSVTRRRAREYEVNVDNWSLVGLVRPKEELIFRGEYLIITASIFSDEIEPLAAQKRARGFNVTVATTAETGVGCAAIRDYVRAWWAARPAGDHYVLLVGDTEFIPPCEDRFGHPTDRLFVCIDGEVDGFDDPYPEARIGRLACDDLGREAECTEMVDKILDYEADGNIGWVEHVTLAADNDGAPGGYEGNQLDVSNGPYATFPTFHSFFGSVDATNAEVRADIDAGRGVVGYRGRGTSTSWSNWNRAGDDFDLAQVELLDNGFRRTPVVFSITALNNRINEVGTDCIGEEWMRTTKRAVAHYSSTSTPVTDAGDMLNGNIFRNIYDEGVTTLGDCIEIAELDVVERFGEFREGEEMAWMYLLLGDPELKVWPTNPHPLFIRVAPRVPREPMFIRVCIGGPCPDDARGGTDGASTDAAALQVGTPLPFAIVSLFKEGEIAENRYTDLNGEAQIPTPALTPGPLQVTAYTEFGSEGVFAGVVEIADFPPEVTAPTSVMGEEGTLISFDVSAADPDSDPVSTLTADLSELPSPNDATFQITGGTPAQPVGTLTWTPTFQDAGTYGVMFTASNELSGSATTSIQVANVSSLRTFLVGGHRVLRLMSGKPLWCVQIEPIGGSFDLTDVDYASITLRSPGTGVVSEIPAISGKSVVVGDRDRNDVEDAGVCFRKEDLRLLLSGISGRVQVTAMIQGMLFSGGSFEAPITIDVVGADANLAASLSRNPVRGSGTLTIVTREPGEITAEVFDVQGRLVRILLGGEYRTAGYHDVSIDGMSRTGERLASGYYIYRVRSRGDTATGGFVLVR